MALVYNYNEDVVTAAFISGLQVTNSFYKYLMKNDVMKMRNILSSSEVYPNRRGDSDYVQPPDKAPSLRSQSHNSP